MKACEECGEPMWTPGPKRRVGLWLRGRLERLALQVDRWSVPRKAIHRMPHIHLTDEEWAALSEFR